MIGKLSEQLERLIPGNLGDEVKQNIEAMVQGHLEQMNLVSREDLEIQQKILRRTEARLKELEQQIAELEKQVNTR